MYGKALHLLVMTRLIKAAIPLRAGVHPALCGSETCQANRERFRAVAAKERILSIRYIAENDRREVESLLLCGFYFGKAQAASLFLQKGSS